MRLPKSETVSRMISGWLSPSFISGDFFMLRMVAFADALRFMFRLCSVTFVV